LTYHPRYDILTVQAGLAPGTTAKEQQMTTYTKAEQQRAFDNLRKWLKPGDTVHTILDHVSSSGMSRDIRVVVLRDGEALHPNWAVQVLLGYPRAKRGDGMRVGGCGMDMGFSIVHNLGYALFGKEAEHGKGKAANALRRAILKADPFYFTQGGRKAPDPTKPSREWFAGAGYALKHKWL
jgi:hypothetical protein